MVVSTAIAIAGIYLAYQMYIKKPEMPKKLAERFGLIYKLLLNKYYIDEIYDTLFVNPIKNGSIFLWESFDNRVIDGIVNGVASFFEGGSSVLRRLQTGVAQSYMLSILIGAVMILGYYLLR